MPVKCFSKKTKKGKSYTICVSPSKVSKRKGRVKGTKDKKTRTRRTRKETAEARKMGAEDKPKKKGKMGGKRKGAGAKKKKKTPKKKSATDEMVSAYENQARGLEPDIYSIIDQGLRDLDASASSIVIERPNQLARQPSNSYWDDPIENDTPAYIQSVQGDMRDMGRREYAERQKTLGGALNYSQSATTLLPGGFVRKGYYTPAEEEEINKASSLRMALTLGADGRGTMRGKVGKFNNDDFMGGGVSF